MEFWKAILGLIRRPLVGPPVVVLSLVLAGLAYSLAPTHYVSSTTMVLTTPPTGGTLVQDPNTPTGLSNPLLTFDDGLRTTASIIIQALNIPDVKQTLSGQDGSTELVVNDGRTDPNLLGTNGPFIHVESDSRSPDGAEQAVSRARQFVQEELARRQQAVGAPPSTFIVAVDVVPPSVPQAQIGAKTQAAVVTMVLSFMLGIGGAYLAFSVLQPVPRARRPALPAPAQLALDSPTVQLPKVAPATNGAALRAHTSNQN